MAKRAAYAALFVLVLPAALIIWARAAAHAVPLPAPRSPAAGVVLLTLGVVLLAAAARDLMVLGGGLPMNAFPPPRLVRAGAYRWIRNPMYIGFGLACAGASITAGSAAGLWLVTPIVALAAAALVLGYERPDLARRLGPHALDPPLLSFPRGDAEPATSQRAAVLVWSVLPSLLAWLAVRALGAAPHAVDTSLAAERSWPVVPWTVIPYASGAVFVVLTVLLVPAQRALRRLGVQGVIATTVLALVWLVIPTTAPARPVDILAPFGLLASRIREHAVGTAALPAMLVLWTLLAADAWTTAARDARASNRSRWTPAAWAWAAIVAASAVASGTHTIFDVLASALLFLLFSRYERVWAMVLRLAERVANSWREWRIGPVRVINHGAYAAAAAGVGLLIAGAAAGREHSGAVLFIALCALVGAGLWAQWLEGSSKLLRPFGWYGGVIGGALGAVVVRLRGTPLLPLLAACAIALPWVQILGRLRCLVQGCCHGSPAPPAAGIRYGHPRSRVAQIAGLAGVPVYPTPLYSILSNAVLGVILLRLRTLGATDGIIAGVYLMLAGIARFVEESYRGEPQTPMVAGLRAYQWLAIASLIIGAACTTLRSAHTARGFESPDARVVWAALVMAVLSGFAMGVDFPASNRRFSRLAVAEDLDSGGRRQDSGP